MIFNKKYIGMMLLMGIVGHVGAMDRQLMSPNKRKRNESFGPDKRQKVNSTKEVIPSGWIPTNEPLKREKEVSSSVKKKDYQVVGLKVSPEDQLSFRDTLVFPYHHQKLSFSLHRKRDVCSASRHMQILNKLEYRDGVVSEIVSSELSTQEKISLFDQLQKTTSDKFQTEIFNEPGSNGHTPLEITAMHDDYELAQDLLYRKADPNKCDAAGRPILFDIQNVEMGKLFVAFGAQIDKTNSLGETILFENATRLPEHQEIATWLISEGMLVNKENKNGEDAYQKQEPRGGANTGLAKEKWAFEMVRKNSGMNNPFALRALQTGQFRLKRS